MTDTSIFGTKYLFKTFALKFVLGSICWAIVVAAVIALVRYASPSDFWAGILLLGASAGFYLWNFVYAISSIIVSISEPISKWLKAGIILVCIADLCCLFYGFLMLLHTLFIN